MREIGQSEKKEAPQASFFFFRRGELLRLGEFGQVIQFTLGYLCDWLFFSLSPWIIGCYSVARVIISKRIIETRK